MSIQSNKTFPLNLESCKENPQREEKKEIQFLNYFSKDKELEHANIDQQKSTTKQIEEKYLNESKEFVENFLKEEKEPLNIIPKKPNMDLKRFLQPKFDKLSKRTDKAIIKLLKQKFKKDQDTDEQNNDKNKKIEEKPKSKLEIENEQIQGYSTVYSKVAIPYDQELIDNEEQELANNNGSELLQEVNADFNIFQNIDQYEDSESY